MHTITRLGAAILALAASIAGPLFAGPGWVEVRPEVRLYGAEAEQIDLGRWAVRRFEAAGLEVPKVEISFHADLSGCGGNLGWAEDGRVDLCTMSVDTPARRALLHELGHIWLDQYTTESLRDRFLELRGLRSWNATSDEWMLRGYEQGAEVFAWALGERIITPKITDNEPVKLEVAFRLLTSREPPELPSGQI